MMGPLLFLTFIIDLPGCEIFRRWRLPALSESQLHIRCRATPARFEVTREMETRMENWISPPEMYSHPVSRKQRPINNKYPLHEHTLRSVSSGKYQGVTLNWTEHICNIRQFMQDPRLFSRKSSGMYCWRQIYCVQYNAQSHLGVCSDGLGPLSTDPLQMLENVQSEAAKFVKDNYYERTPGCVTSMK